MTDERSKKIVQQLKIDFQLGDAML